MAGDEIVLHRTAGTRAFLRGRDHVRRGELDAVRGDAAHGQVSGQVGVGVEAHHVMAVVARHADGSTADVRGSCSCGSGPLCQHAVALLLATMPDLPGLPGVRGRVGDGPVTEPAPAERAPRQPAAWERSLADLLVVPAAAGVVTRPQAAAEVALQFEFVEAASAVQIMLRPVLRGRSGGWVRSGISWGTLEYLGYGHPQLRPSHLRLLAELLALQGQGHYYSRYTTVQLETISSRRVWDLLLEAQEIGLPLVQPGRRADPVIVHSQPARAQLDVVREGEGIVVRPRLMVGGIVVPTRDCLPIGDPPHGLAWWTPSVEQASGRAGTVQERPIDLAPMAGRLDPAVAALLDSGELRIPEVDQERFLRDYYPELRQRVTVVSGDASVQLPQPLPPVLTLTVTGAGEHRVGLSWGWAYAVGPSRRVEPLRADPGGQAGRDDVTEARILGEVSAVCAGLGALYEAARYGPRLAAEAQLRGIDTARLLTEVIPLLAELPDVEVQLALGGPAPHYREAVSAPEISFAGQDSSGEHDWFDLGVTVTVDGEDVPFQQLFLALAQSEPFLVLPSGTYFSLDRDDFAQLGRLIAESRALTDAPTGVVRLNRFQAGLWAEVEQLGQVTGQAAVWQESVRALVAAAPSVPDLPQGLHATLRPYQRDGFGWLATLFEHRLGGVLADDMGLGKTLQALVLMQHARERGLVEVPFLVVAPTSVVGNWATEASRFAPDLSVSTITQMQARRGQSVEQIAAVADVVITSYALFRLEFEQYQATTWAGLVLDEAQNVKNHQSAGYRCARTLDTPFKLAITGTPMENNLMELWSLLSITAPGLLSSPTRFTEYYRTPIEKGRDGDLLAQLRRRIRPLMLRRTKEQVAADLPDKQEQVIELDLNPRHRKVYQTYLQRERQKVLGLLGDLRQNRFEIFRSLTLLRQASLDVGLVDPKHEGVPSTKLDALLDQIKDVAQEGHRVLVFSQFTRFLTAARDRLDAAGIEFCYLDGSTTRRAAVVNRFRTG
ncbi:MAG TPA: SNF2-related protein, partial [Kineosporiaceae bacterium]|nr:SNF2-related protein [Kineosporiaceae bacterium]